MRGLVPYAWRGLVARRARSTLTVLGVAIGVAMLMDWLVLLPRYFQFNSAI